MLLLSILFLLFTSFRSAPRLLESFLFRIDSNLLYLILSSIACGAFLMFLLFSFFPRRQTQQLRVSSAPSSSLLSAAEMSMQLGDYEQAMETLNRLLPNDHDYWYGRKLAGDIRMLEEKWEEAEGLYQSGLKAASGPNRALLFLALGEMYDRRKSSDQAVIHYREAMRISPGSIQPVLLLRDHAVQDGEWRQALSWQEHLEEHFQKELKGEEEENARVGIRYQLAESQYESGAYKTAIALLKYVKKLQPAFTPAYLLAGNALEKLGNYSTAFKNWEKGFTATGHPVLLERLGEYFLSRNLPELAIRYMRNEISLHPEDSFVHFCLADLFIKLEMPEDAMRVCKRLEEVNPEWQYNRYVLAGLHKRAGNFEAAARLFEKVLDAADPSSGFRWKCYDCNTTYHEYRSFCYECLSWNSVNYNQQKAVNLGASYDQPTALHF